ncbi:PilN domain-containing protein [uncultured Tateyamaria sp.]|uniref:PilN domain-containing protein n=1 Tax=Tateyamaria sp. 1078 TaxID=3417464 RepID=UPI002616E8AE|nr:PilN domain-containing protein [uncultured Tateyamaria sp.]
MSRTKTSNIGTGPVRLLSKAVPDWLAALFLGRPRARALSFDDVETLTRRHGRHIAPWGWLDPKTELPKKIGRGFVDVALPANRVLKREVHLPRTPGRMIERAVTLDMLRRTPFKADQTYAALSDIEIDSAGTRLTHWVARRDDIDRLRTRLAAAGLKTRRVTVEGVPAAPLVDFTPQTYPSGRRWRALNAVALVALLGAGVWIWAEPTLRAQDALRAQTEELQRLTETALTLRQSIEAQGTEQGERTAFMQRMTRRTPMVTMLRTATVILPDTVWITDMAIDRNRVVVRGSTAGSAAQMLLDLPDNRLLLNPQLAGPVSQTTDGRERFEIVFQTPHGSS